VLPAKATVLVNHASMIPLLSCGTRICRSRWTAQRPVTRGDVTLPAKRSITGAFVFVFSNIDGGRAGPSEIDEQGTSQGRVGAWVRKGEVNASDDQSGNCWIPSMNTASTPDSDLSHFTRICEERTDMSDHVRPCPTMWATRAIGAGLPNCYLTHLAPTSALPCNVLVISP